jgi:NTE family protein
MDEQREQKHKESGAVADGSAEQDLTRAPEIAAGRTGAEARTRPGAPKERRRERTLLAPFEACAPAPDPTREEKRIPKRLNLVFEGAGVLEFAAIGALAALEQTLFDEDRYKETYISYIAGSSSGAMTAALLGAGYSCSEIADLIPQLEAAMLADASWLSRVPILGKQAELVWRFFTHSGMKGDHLLAFLREALQAKGIRTFGDLIMPGCERQEDLALKYRVHLTASDITRTRMLVLPDDMNTELYGVAPEDLDVALAVLMSMSCPPYYRPVRLRGANGVESYIVDGALTSRFPVHLFDVGAREDTLILGIRTGAEKYNEINFPSFISFWGAMYVTALTARDVSEASKRIDKLKWARAVDINTGDMSIFDFPLTRIEREGLHDAGYVAMKRAIDANVLERATTHGCTSTWFKAQEIENG